MLALANRLIATTGRSKALATSRPAGPPPTIRPYGDDDAELGALVAESKRLIAAGVRTAEIAVLVRMNSQLAAIEQALTRAALPYQVRGQRFYERRDVRDAIGLLRSTKPAERGPSLAAAIRAVWQRELGYDEGVVPEGPEGRERAAALDTLLAILDELIGADGTTDIATYLADLAARDAAERAGSAGGINLLTYHRAKGMEWDAVFLPMLEEGFLPIHHALDDPEALAEERRLLYVGITRARTHLALSWAEYREGATGRGGKRRPSRFLADLAPPRPRRVTQLPDAVRVPVRNGLDLGSDPLVEGLRAWRSARAKADGVPAYVVAHDSTLAAIAERRPSSIAELRRVSGIGPAKLEKYGPEILEVTARFPATA